MTINRGINAPFRPGDGTRVVGRRQVCQCGAPAQVPAAKCRSCLKEYRRWYHVARKYGLTQEQYAEMVAERDGRCDVCKKKPAYALKVDHCHETGVVRGLLCQPCNVAIGNLGDNAEGLRRALDYLEKPR